MNYVDSNLMKNERVLYRAKIHWLIYSKPILLVALGIAATYAASNPDIRAPWPGLVGILVILYGLIIGIAAIVTVLTTEMAVTNRRVIAKRGLIRRSTVELNHTKIETLGVDQGILDRIFGSGTVAIGGTGGVISRFPGIDNPLAFRREALQAADTSQE